VPAVGEVTERHDAAREIRQREARCDDALLDDSWKASLPSIPSEYETPSRSGLGV